METISHSPEPVEKDLARFSRDRDRRGTVREGDYLRCTIKDREGHTFTIQQITDPEDPLLYQVQQLLEETFSSEEVDPFEVLKACVSKDSPELRFAVSPYKVFAVTNEKGEVVAMHSGGHVHMCDESLTKTTDTFYARAYAVTKEEYKGKGLIKEAYVSALEACQMEARNRGYNLKYVVIESALDSEGYHNSTALKRIYIGDRENKGTYNEVAYQSPPLEFDEDSGDVAEGAGAVAEHLMVRRFDGKIPNSEDLITLVRSMYCWNAVWGEEDFYTLEAYLHHKEIINDLLNTFAAQFRKGESKPVILMLDARNSEKARNYISRVHVGVGKLRWNIVNDYEEADGD